MYSKTVLALLSVLITFAFFEASNGELSNGKMKISVVTTAGCSDTVRFINNQLIPTYLEFGRYLDLEFIPWGRSVRNQDGSLTCQFGANDCWANRVHRCALDMLKPIQNSQLSYMACEFLDINSRPAFLEGTYQCGQLAGIDILTLNQCVATNIGDHLEREAEIAAAYPMSVINFVPAIFFNDTPISSWVVAFSNLRNTVCNMLLTDPSTDVNSC